MINIERKNSQEKERKLIEQQFYDMMDTYARQYGLRIADWLQGVVYKPKTGIFYNLLRQEWVFSEVIGYVLYRKDTDEIYATSRDLTVSVINEHLMISMLKAACSGEKRPCKYITSYLDEIIITCDEPMRQETTS